MKICFIKLKELYRIDPYSDPPLGILSIMAVMKQEHDILFCDMTHETIIPDADVYTISACTLEYPELEKIAKKIKKEKNKPIIVGGPHFDLLSEAYWKMMLSVLPIDIICRGEGENTLPRAIKHIGKKQIINQNKPVDFNSLPFPAREFLNKDKYFREGIVFSGKTIKKGNSTTIMTSRGCPMACAFCASPQLHHRKLRFRSIKKVKEEIIKLKKTYNISELRFQDDSMGINFIKFPELPKILKNLNIRYRCSNRTDLTNDDLLDKLWYSGCREIGFGIESAENHILKLLNKGTTVEINKTALIKSKERGFKVRAFMMTGLPGETKDSAKRTIDFLEETNPDIVTMTTFMPLPGSDTFNNPQKYGINILTYDWSKYNIAISRKSSPWIHTISTATPDEMEENRELLKEYLFNKKKFNVKEFNKPYRRKHFENTNKN